MTDVLVPDTSFASALTASLVGSVVRLKKPQLSIGEGAKGLICAERSKGRYTLQVVVPGFPITFWVQPGDVDVISTAGSDAWKALNDLTG